MKCEKFPYRVELPDDSETNARAMEWFRKVDWTFCDLSHIHDERVPEGFKWWCVDTLSIARSFKGEFGGRLIDEPGAPETSLQKELRAFAKAQDATKNKKGGTDA
jgi:hypothetical protein